MRCSTSRLVPPVVCKLSIRIHSTSMRVQHIGPEVGQVLAIVEDPRLIGQVLSTTALRCNAKSCQSNLVASHTSLEETRLYSPCRGGPTQSIVIISVLSSDSSSSPPSANMLCRGFVEAGVEKQHCAGPPPQLDSFFSLQDYKRLYDVFRLKAPYKQPTKREVNVSIDAQWSRFPAMWTRFPTMWTDPAASLYHILCCIPRAKFTVG